PFGCIAVYWKRAIFVSARTGVPRPAPVEMQHEALLFSDERARRAPRDGRRCRGGATHSRARRKARPSARDAVCGTSLRLQLCATPDGRDLHDMLFDDPRNRSPLVAGMPNTLRNG